jgi:hypothetical protein
MNLSQYLFILKKSILNLSQNSFNPVNPSLKLFKPFQFKLNPRTVYHLFYPVSMVCPSQLLFQFMMNPFKQLLILFQSMMNPFKQLLILFQSMMNPFKQLLMLFQSMRIHFNSCLCCAVQSMLNPSHADAFFNTYILNQCQQLVVYNLIYAEPIATFLYTSYEYSAFFLFIVKNYHKIIVRQV